MKLSRRQQIALKLLDAAWTDIEWPAVSAVLNLFGERAANGAVTCNSLVKKGLVRRIGFGQWRQGNFYVTDNGRKVAKMIKVTVQIEQVNT